MIFIFSRGIERKQTQNQLYVKNSILNFEGTTKQQYELHDSYRIV